MVLLVSFLQLMPKLNIISDCAIDVYGKPMAMMISGETTFIEMQITIELFTCGFIVRLQMSCCFKNVLIVVILGLASGISLAQVKYLTATLLLHVPGIKFQKW